MNRLPFIANAQAVNASGPLRVHPSNPRYLTDGTRVVYLAGMHDGWEVQDNAFRHTQAVIFDFDSFLAEVVANDLNLMRFWTVEHAKSGDASRFLVDPMPYRRVPGYGAARDGQDKFDLDQFEPRFFERLRQRVIAAGEHGVYGLVMLFCGLSAWGGEQESWGLTVNNSAFHPYFGGNNIQGLDADLDGDGRVREVHTWQGEAHWITQRQRAYVQHVIDALNDLDNVLWEICNECPMVYGREWQYRMVEWIQAYEAQHKPKQHPVLFSGGGERIGDVASNPALFDGPAECIAPDHNGAEGLYMTDLPAADGRRVIILDTDHIYGEYLKDRRWVWKAFASGHNPLYMDQWTFEREDPARVALRRALGQTRRWAARLDLSTSVPHPELASTGYCLATPGVEYFVYQPLADGAQFTLAVEAGLYHYEWFDPARGCLAANGDMLAAGGAQRFIAPMQSDAVVYLKRTQS